MTKLLIAFFLLGAALGDGILADRAFAQQGIDCNETDFKYLVLDNSLYSAKVRHIDVFLDERAFNETNLTVLFRLLSKKNPGPTHLTVEVKTNWAQLSYPTDCAMASSIQPARKDEFDYHFAIYQRRDREKMPEYFEYNPVLKKSDLKTVVLK